MRATRWARVAAWMVAGCGTPPPTWAPDSGACEVYQVPDGTDSMTPAAQLRRDVMPILDAHCGSPQCHGSPTSPSGGVFLGASSAMGSDAALARTATVDVTSNELPSMRLVTAGDPSASYLMHKLDGDQCAFAASCAGGDCESSMPDGTATLATELRDTVRRWIAQGAQDD